MSAYQINQSASSSFFSKQKQDRKSYFINSGVQTLGKQSKEDLFGQIYSSLSTASKDAILQKDGRNLKQNGFITDDESRQQRERVMGDKWREEPFGEIQQEFIQPTPQKVTKSLQRLPDDELLYMKPEDLLNSGKGQIRSMREQISLQIASKLKDQEFLKEKKEQMKQELLKEKIQNHMAQPQSRSVPTLPVKPDVDDPDKKATTITNVDIKQVQDNKVLQEPILQDDNNLIDPFQFQQDIKFDEDVGLVRTKPQLQFTIRRVRSKPKEEEQQIQISIQKEDDTDTKQEDVKDLLDNLKEPSMITPRQTNQKPQQTSNQTYQQNNHPAYQDWNFNNRVFYSKSGMRKVATEQEQQHSSYQNNHPQRRLVKKSAFRANKTKKFVRFSEIASVKLQNGEQTQQCISDNYKIKKMNTQQKSFSTDRIDQLWNFQ